jgi:hypothetical protein
MTIEASADNETALRRRYASIYPRVADGRRASNEFTKLLGAVGV